MTVRWQCDHSHNNPAVNDWSACIKSSFLFHNSLNYCQIKTLLWSRLHGLFRSCGSKEFLIVTIGECLSGGVVIRAVWTRWNGVSWGSKNHLNLLDEFWFDASYNFFCYRVFTAIAGAVDQGNSLILSLVSAHALGLQSQTYELGKAAIAMEQ